MQLFRPALEAELIDRPNRFLVRVSHRGRILEAHCANPGSMLELLHPGSRVILEPAEPGRLRKTGFTLAAVYHGGRIIPLISTRANQVAEKLVIPRLFPDATEIRSEFTHGESRFDFGLYSQGSRWLVEVKACTLVHDGLAMFPDSPTGRGARHLQELAEPPDGTRGALVIVVGNPDAQSFAPNIHTDPRFSTTIIRASATVPITVVSTVTEADGTTRIARDSLPVRWDLAGPPLERDSGVYLFTAEIGSPKRIHPGALGAVNLKKGFYVYTGSAMRNLSSRTARHLRRRKKMRWHVDWLRAAADRVRALPIRTVLPLECELAHTVAELGDEIVPAFGCSDCDCRSHLTYYARDPLTDPRFIDALLTYRHSRAFARSP